MDLSICPRPQGDSLMRLPYRDRWIVRLAKSGWRNDGAAQLVEFAVALPLLVLFVVGIFDFSNAFTLKQKLTNATRDAARATASDPATDLDSPVPASVTDAFQYVHNYMIANNINDCGVSPIPAPTPPTTWTFTGTAVTCPPGGLVLTINRGYYYPTTGGSLATIACNSQSPAGQTAVISTCVSIQYAYAWKFGRVASILGSTGTLPTSLTAVSVAMNEN
jgi:hypothetical protein